MSVMTIRVVTPDKLVFDGEAERVFARGIDGDFAVLHNHIPMMTPLGVGELRIDMNGESSYIAIDNEQINIKNTYALSYQLMKKHYKDYIALLISFIPHDVFSALSFKLYDLYLVPLKNLSYSKLYIDLYFNQVEE